MAWIPAVIFAAFAFLKINDISLFRMVLLGIERSSKPNLRTWRSFPGISINIVTKPEKEVIDPNAPKVIRATSRLTQLAAQLEEEQKKLLDEAQALQAQLPVANTAPSAPVQTPAQSAATVQEPYEQNVSISLPVDPSRIQAEALHPHFRLDGIRTDTLRHSF
jgi:hypothetical protein